MACTQLVGDIQHVLWQHVGPLGAGVPVRSDPGAVTPRSPAAVFARAPRQAMSELPVTLQTGQSPGGGALRPELVSWYRSISLESWYHCILAPHSVCPGCVLVLNWSPGKWTGISPLSRLPFGAARLLLTVYLSLPALPSGLWVIGVTVLVRSPWSSAQGHVEGEHRDPSASVTCSEWGHTVGTGDREGTFRRGC